MHRGHTRDRLIEAALELFWERSFHATGVDELCIRADARKGSFYHFFASKTDLAVAAVERRWATTRADVFEVIARSDSLGLGRLRRLLDAIVEQQARAVFTNHVVLGSPFGNLGQETSHRDERLRRVVLSVFDEQCLFIQSWLDEAVSLGEVPEGDTLGRARNILALLEGALLLAKIADDVDLFRVVGGAVPLLAEGRS